MPPNQENPQLHYRFGVQPTIVATDNTTTLLDINFGSSWVWKHFAVLAAGPRKNSKGAKTDIVCRVCYEAQVQLSDCLVSLYKNQSSNAIRHVQAKHPNLLPKTPAPTQPNTQLKPSPNSMTDFLQMGNDATISKVHACVSRLVVNRKTALSLATDVDLNAVIDAASYLAPGSYKPMTRFELDKSVVHMFNAYVLTVKSLFAKARALYSSTTDGGESCGWLTVCHDGWDSSIKQFFGVSVFWIDLDTW